MKNFLFLALLSLILLASCVSLKTTTQPPQQSITETKEDPAIVWKQSYFNAIEIKDNVSFYNGDSIVIKKTFENQTFFVDEGIVKVVDSLSTVSKIVPAMTPGLWISGSRTPYGEIKTMLVSFSKNEASYNLTYVRADDGSFLLINRANIIFRGRSYPVEVSTSDRRLFFYIKKYEVKEKITDQAEGRKQ